MTRWNASALLGRRRLGLLLLLLAAFALGWLLRGGGAGQAPPTTTDLGAAASEWTCSMHPQIRQPNFGACPLCGMDLIPVETDAAGEEGEAVLTLSPRARKLASVETAPVERRFVEAELRLVGKVELDETRVKRIAAWTAGRLDRLYVDYTGIAVKRGEHLVDIYSPELITGQEELLQALAARDAMAAGASEFSRESSQRTVVAAREKLRLLGLAPEQIEALESRGEAAEHVTMYAPIGGVVIAKSAVEGSYVQTGSPLFTIADLSRVWVMLAAYETDLPWIRYGQAVEFSSAAHPGETFTGRVAFVDPLLDERTRTARVRVHLPNPEGRLKPGTFVRGVLRPRLAANGLASSLDLAGKWISPMHPEIIKDGPGSCDVCGMPLVPTESLGYVTAEEGQQEAPLVIPASAPLVTGERAVVYVADAAEEGRYEGREVVLGPRAGGDYIVREGLVEGEQVVVRGNFKIDSALQILARPSMMNPSAETGDTGMSADKSAFAVAESFLADLESVYAHYLSLQYALSHDQFAPVKQHARELEQASAKVNRSEIEERAAQEWQSLSKSLTASARELAASADMEAARLSFDGLSRHMIVLARRFGRAGGETLYLYHCPMAFDWRGADWLQGAEDLENPYFGAAMFKCGTLEGTIPGGDGDD